MRTNNENPTKQNNFLFPGERPVYDNSPWVSTKDLKSVTYYASDSGEESKKSYWQILFKFHSGSEEYWWYKTKDAAIKDLKVLSKLVDENPYSGSL